MATEGLFPLTDDEKVALTRSRGARSTTTAIRYRRESGAVRHSGEAGAAATGAGDATAAQGVRRALRVR
jgi:hypothetical protein